MGFQKVVDTAEINFIFTYHGEIVQNVYYAERPGGYEIGDITSLANHMDLQVGVTWLAEMPLEVSYLRTEVLGLAVENDLLVTDSDNAGPGEDLSPGLPGNVTFSIKKVSGFTGRSARGRTFWIGIPTDKLQTTDENRLTSAYVDAIVANVNVIRAQIPIVTGWQAVLVSRFAGGAKRTEGKTFPWTGSLAVDDVVDTHRNRLP